jgi:hypothetical protein
MGTTALVQSLPIARSHSMFPIFGPGPDPGAATHVLNVDMVGQNLANTTTSLKDKNIVFLFKT